MTKGNAIESELDEAQAAGFHDADSEDDNFADMFDENEELVDDGSGGDPVEAEYADPHDDEPADEAGATGVAQDLASAAADDDQLGGPGGDPSEELDGGDDEAGEAAEGDEEWPEILLRSMGMDQEQAEASFGTPEVMADHLRQFDTNLIQSRRAQVPAPAPAPEPEAEEPDFDVESVIPEDWSDDVKDTFRKMSDAFDQKMAARDKRIEAQEQALVQQRMREEAVANQRYADEFDEFVDNLGDAWIGTFGKGKTEKLDSETFAYRNRIMLDQTAGQLAASLHEQGMPVPDATELRLRAMHSMFPQMTRQAAAREVAEQVEQRQRQFTHRPSGRRSKPMSGEMRAIKRAQDLFDKRGMSEAHLDDEIDEI